MTINAPLTWNTGTGILTLSAYNNIYLTSSINAVNGGLTLTANPSGIITPASGSSINVGTFTLQSGTWQESAASLSGFTAKDFRISGGSVISGSVGTVTPLAVTLSGSRTYDGTTAAGSILSVTNAIGADVVTVANADSEEMTATGTLTLGGASAGNYTLTGATGSVTVTPAVLTVTANDASRYTGRANPAFTAGYSGLAGSDTAAALSGSLSFDTAATKVSLVGRYAISLTGTLTSPNYTVRYGNGTLTVQSATTSAYLSAITSAGANAVFLPLPGSGDAAPLTIVPPGVNTSGYIPLTVLGDSGQGGEGSHEDQIT